MSKVGRKGFRRRTRCAKLCSMDIVQQRRAREWTLLLLVGAMALVANLPDDFLALVRIERGVIMAVLGLVVVMALFLYVRFFFFLLYTLLAVGANLPEQWATSLNIAQGPLLMTLICMVSLSLLNYAIKLSPSGLEPQKKKPNAQAIQVLLNAIDRGNLPQVKSVLSMDFDLNMMGERGQTPLIRAAQRGDAVIVDLLLQHGADPSMMGAEGLAADAALQAGHPELAAKLRELTAHLQPQPVTGELDIASIG